MRTLEQITTEVDLKINAGLYLPPPTEPEFRAAEIQRVVSEEARKFLASTDWYVVRKLETGVEIPTEISIARAEARLRVI